MNKISTSIIIAGKLQRGFIFTSDSHAYSNVPGGSLLYAAAGLGLWNFSAGLLSNTGEDYPQEWINKVRDFGFDISGINIVESIHNSRSFLVNRDHELFYNENPIAYYSRAKLPMPKSLLGYKPDVESQNNNMRNDLDNHQLFTIPESYNDASNLLLSPYNFHSQSQLITYFLGKRIKNIFLQPGHKYMHPLFWNEMPKLLNGITAFITSEKLIRSLFQGRSNNLNEMAEILASLGCNIIIISRAFSEQHLYDHYSNTHWSLSAYPVNVLDHSGYLDAFSGGFSACYSKSYDPLEALVCGNISASFASEGVNPFYLFDTLPSLVKARADFIRNMARKM